MVTIVMKTTFTKMEPKNYFCNDTFRESLQNIVLQHLKKSCDDHYYNFVISCKNVLLKIAPCKKKYLKGNHSPFMNKYLSNTIMVRTKLRSTFLKKKQRK